jgi:hypothetical protein
MRTATIVGMIGARAIGGPLFNAQQLFLLSPDDNICANHMGDDNDLRRGKCHLRKRSREVPATTWSSYKELQEIDQVLLLA